MSSNVTSEMYYRAEDFCEKYGIPVTDSNIQTLIQIGFKYFQSPEIYEAWEKRLSDWAVENLTTRDDIEDIEDIEDVENEEEQDYNQDYEDSIDCIIGAFCEVYKYKNSRKNRDVLRGKWETYFKDSVANYSMLGSVKIWACHHCDKRY